MTSCNDDADVDYGDFDDDDDDDDAVVDEDASGHFQPTVECAVCFQPRAGCSLQQTLELLTSTV